MYLLYKGPALAGPFFDPINNDTCLRFAENFIYMLKDFLSNKRFNAAIILTVVTGFYLVTDSFIIGKDIFFLVLNKDLGKTADLFFSLWTNLGDGIVWVPVAILFFIYRKNKIPVLLAAIVISTLITQVTKNYILPEELRPTAAITGDHSIHTVPGVELLTVNSFPSGHTATAFTIFLLGCLLIRKNWIVPVGFVYAILVGYSRIYLAQHFPLDVGGGMLTAAITVILSIQIQKRWELRNIEQTSKE